MRSVPEIIKNLIIINLIFFIGTLVIGNFAYDILALHYPKNPSFGYWQLLTHMFMHGGIYHNLVNMFGLWMFGSPLVQMWGRNKFLFYYISCGIGAALLQLLFYYFQINAVVDNLLSQGYLLDEIYNDVLPNKGTYFDSKLVGASGALYGILVAFAFLFPNSELMLIFLPVPIKAKFFVPIILILDLFLGFSSYSIGPIAHFAHVGGAITGFVMLWYWKRNQFNNKRWN